MYKDDFLIQMKQNKYVYNGETEEELKYILNKKFSIDLNYDNVSMKPPIGCIFIGKEYLDTWITKRNGFFGWNIVKTNVKSNEIKFK